MLQDFAFKFSELLELRQNIVVSVPEVFRDDVTIRSPIIFVHVVCSFLMFFQDNVFVMHNVVASCILMVQQCVSYSLCIIQVAMIHCFVIDKLVFITLHLFHFSCKTFFAGQLYLLRK